MWNDCGRTGCAGGGGSFLLFVAFCWLAASYFVLFSDPKSFREYAKGIPARILLFGVVTGIFWVIGWTILKIEQFMLV